MVQFVPSNMFYLMGNNDRTYLTSRGGDASWALSQNIVKNDVSVHRNRKTVVRQYGTPRTCFDLQWPLALSFLSVCLV
jgi:hypothetical protein